MSDHAPRSKKARGRPPKFREPRRPVTVTLPDRTLAQLEKINSDRAYAIVKAADHATRGEIPGDGVRVVNVSRNAGLILVRQCRALREIPFLSLVEVSPLRFLLALKDGATAEVLEVALHDLLDSLPPGDPDREILKALQLRLASLRRGHSVERAEILIVRRR